MKHKLSVRFLLLSVGNSVILSAVIIAIVYFQLDARMINEYTKTARGVAEVMAREIDADKIDEYLTLNHSLQEYELINRELEALKESFSDILYMYIYVCKPDGGHTVFDICEDPDEPGFVYAFEDGFFPYLDELCAGEEIPVLTDRTKYGYLLTYTKPVFDSKGDYACTIFLDFSMDKLHAQDVGFIIRIAILSTAIMLLMLLLYTKAIQRLVLKPIGLMTACINSFKYEDEEDRFRNLRAVEELKIHTEDELETLYNAFVSAVKDAFYYITNLNIAKADLQDKDKTIANISAKATRDSLTGVGNKAAYLEAAAETDRSIKAGNAEFAVLMADINKLKYVNDTFGHDRGDAYIKGCCKILCSILKSSPVFRIGGDEFVCIVKNEDFLKREEILSTLKKKYEESYSAKDKEPYERYSVSMGISVYSEGNDSCTEDVLKRADENMYSFKKEFQAKYGSYR